MCTGKKKQKTGKKPDILIIYPKQAFKEYNKAKKETILNTHLFLKFKL